MIRLPPRAAIPCLAAGLILAGIGAPAPAQLQSEEVQDTSRICRYFGTDTSPDGQIVPRTFTVGVGQDCPATAPYRDPDARIPDNAMLTGERTGPANRVCVYEEGGLRYEATVDIALRCAPTPALLARAQSEAPARPSQGVPR